MSDEHALLSASGSPRWCNCPGSLAACKDIPNVTSEFAEEGTAAHKLASTVLLTDGTIAEDYLGKKMNDTIVDDEMVEHIQDYVDFIRDITGDGTLMVEKKVDYSQFIGVDNSFGTADAIILSNDWIELCIADLKYGKGVAVYAEENEQLMMYVLGALDELSILFDDIKKRIKRIRMIIYQPRRNNISEWDCSMEHLLEFAARIKPAAEHAKHIYDNPILLTEEMLIPGDRQCKWCPAKTTCPALSKFVQDTVGAMFEDCTEGELPVDKTDLSTKMKAVPLIEVWCKAVRTAVENDVFAGVKVKGFKLVGGRKGRRKWTDPVLVEKIMVTLKLAADAMYTKKLITPPAAEKLLKKDATKWEKLKSMIIQKDGKPAVVPESDPREEVKAIDVAGNFDVEDDD